MNLCFNYVSIQFTSIIQLEKGALSGHDMRDHLDGNYTVMEVQVNEGDTVHMMPRLSFDHDTNVTTWINARWYGMACNSNLI